MTNPTFAYERGLPVNLDAERMVLSAILNTPEVFPTLELEPDDFSLEANRKSFTAIQALHSGGKDIGRIELKEHLEARNQFESVGGLRYLIELEENPPMAFNLASYVGIIRDKKTLRRAIHTLEKAVLECYRGIDTPETILANVQAMTSGLTVNLRERQSLKSVEEIVTAAGGVDAFLSPKREESSGVAIPWPKLAALIPLLKKNGLSIIGGQPGWGKSAFGLDLAIACARLSKAAPCFSMEMGEEEYLQRAVAAAAGVNMYKHMTGYSSAEERDRLARGLGELAQTPLYIDDKTGTTMAGIRSAVQRLQARQEIGLVVIDFAQLVKGKGDTRAEEVSGIARDAKIMAIDLGIHVVLLSQLGRVAAKAWEDGQEPEMRFLKESGGLEEAANNVFTIWPKRDEMRAAKESPVPVPIISTEIHLLKHRGGPTGMVRMQFNKQFTRFEEAA